MIFRSGCVAWRYFLVCMSFFKWYARRSIQHLICARSIPLKCFAVAVQLLCHPAHLCPRKRFATCRAPDNPAPTTMRSWRNW